MSRLKMLILDDCEALLRKLEVAITKYEVIRATTIEGAMGVIETKDISFIVADIRLRDGENGHRLFEQLFSKGKLVPGIVMSAFVVSQSVRNELSYIGVTEVIQKEGIGLDDAIENAAEKILTDGRKQLTQLTNKVTKFGLWDALLARNGGSIKDALNYVWDGDCSAEERIGILDAIIQECNKTSRLDDRDYPFPEIGYVQE